MELQQQAAAAAAAESYTRHVCYRLKECSLKSCQISHPEFSDKHAEILAKDGLCCANMLRKLEIMKCPKLTGRGIAQISVALQKINVSHLSFEIVPNFGDDGLQAIRNFLLNNNNNISSSSETTKTKTKTTSLKFLGLEAIGPISDSVWDEFLSVASRKVQSLDLSYNSLTKDRMNELASGIRSSSSSNNNNNLTALILTGNPIGDEGMERLSEALSYNRSSMMLLAVGECQLTDRGISALRHALQTNCSLQRLYVYGNSGINLNSIDNVMVRYWLDMNTGRRAFVRSVKCRPSYLPSILSKSTKRPDIVYGLLQELPHLWLPAMND